MQDMSGALAAIVGLEYVRGLEGAVAVAPGNTEEIAAVLRLAQENHLAVVACGGRTKQGWGYPVTPSLVLEMHRLNALREHTWQDMTCSVEEIGRAHV